MMWSINKGVFCRTVARSHHQGGLVSAQVRGRTVLGHVGGFSRFVLLGLLFEPGLSDLEDQALQDKSRETPLSSINKVKLS